MTTSPRRGRFAPTPSGELHIGNAFAALCAWLQMRQAGGVFVLRIEDIDTARSRPGLAEQQLSDLRWLGLDWDEGPDVGGPYAPYVQSERIPLYEDALEKLAHDRPDAPIHIDTAEPGRSEREGRLYPCFCSRADLAAIASAPHGLASEGAVYPGTCRNLTEVERAARSASKTPSLRFRMPDRELRFADPVSSARHVFQGAALGDFIVKRADGMISYQLAVTVDDAAMAVTDVLRGADLIDSTPRQLALYEALGFAPPAFTHVPLVCGGDGVRLSKRDKSLSLAALRAANVRPERLTGMFAALAGWIDRPEPLAVRDLIPLFGPIRRDELRLDGTLLNFLR